MGFGRVEQTLAVAAGQSGLERSDAVGVHPFEMGGHAGKSVELGQIARRGDDEAAIRADFRIGLTPEPGAFRSQLGDDRLGAFAFAIRGDHCAGDAARGFVERVG